MSTKMASYTPPHWGRAGANVFGIYVDVIKSGVIIETLQLPCSEERSYVLAGRMETVCDVALTHPSISRTHAALQFDDHGALFLYDIHSTHGCFVNKKRIAADEFVRLHIGDVVGFGESTRLYAVCGPPELLPAEYESLNLVTFRERLKQREEEQETLWRLQDDAEEEEEDGEEESEDATVKEELPEYLWNLTEEEQPYTSRVSQSEVNEKDQRLYHQLQVRIRKMENLKLEKSRILAKQNRLDGLSEGQQLTLERNEQRIETLLKEIEALESRIQAKNDQRRKTRGGSALAVKKHVNVNEELYGYNSDEDDFYDRTKANLQKIAARKEKVKGMSTDAEATVAATVVKAQKNEVLTVASIQKNIKELKVELTQLHDDMALALTRFPAQKEKKQEEEDSLDSFMVTTTTQLHVNEMDVLKKRIAELETKLKYQQDLLVIATPALAALPVQPPAKEAVKELKKDPPESSSLVAHSVKEAKIGDTVSVDRATTCGSISVEALKDKSALLLRKKTKENVESSCVKKAASPKRRRILGPVKVVALPEPREGSDEQLSNGSSVLEGGDHAWLPPTNQTGDGRTKLNDKFGY